MVGTALSHYNITAELGRGGMGIVYKAEDTKLDRTVAIKVLPPSALSNEDDRARFYREAKAAAQLHHPHIASIFEIDQAVPEGGSAEEPRPFIAMEYIEGEQLDERIKAGLFSLEDAVRVASQMASALEAAHEKNIVHRDIKSANVMFTKKRHAKVLDFGLAQTSQSTKLTRMGSTLGTIAYMSPEQARGEEVDQRTDLWSLGVVLYEMIAGRMPFAADYEQAAVYGILNEDPQPLTALRTGVPMGLEWIVTKLLAKKASDRYQNASDLQVDLRNVDVSATASMSSVSTTAKVPPMTDMGISRNAWKGLTKYAIGGAVGAVLVVLVWMLQPGESLQEPAPPIRLSHSIQASMAPTNLAISHDGLRVAYMLSEGVYVLDLSSGESRLLDGTQNTTVFEFSPDDETLLLTKTVSIDRVPVSGGSPLEVIRTTEGGPRAAWGPEGWVIFEDEQQIFKYSESRDERIQITTRDSLAGEYDYDWPSMLPDGKTLMTTVETTGQPARVRFIDFETGTIKKTINFAGYSVRYHKPGYLSGIVSDEGLVAVPFDIDRLEMTGPRRSIISVATQNLTSVSDNGTLVYSELDQSGSGVIPVSQPTILTFPEFKEKLPIPEGMYSSFRLSPDESKLAYVNHVLIGGTQLRSINVYDFATGQQRPISQSNLVNYPVWRPDGDSVAYFRSDFLGGPQSIYAQAADGSGSEKILFGGRSRYKGFDFSPDGEIVLGVAEVGPAIGLLRYINLVTDERTTLAGFDAPVDIRRPRISRDGRYVVYQGGADTFVNSMDGSGNPYNISRGFAEFPQFSADGRFYFQVTFQGSIQRFAVLNSEPTFSLEGNFEEVAVLGFTPPFFEVFSDGQRAIIGDVVGAGTSTASDSTVIQSFPLHFVLNWFEELK